MLVFELPAPVQQDRCGVCGVLVPDGDTCARGAPRCLFLLKVPYNANSTFVVLLYVHMRSWHVSQPTNA